MDVLLGKPKTRKSTYIYEKLQEDLRNNILSILFVPSQLRVNTENEYMDFLKNPGMIDTNITTIDTYIKENIANFSLNDDDKFLSKLDKKIILTDVITKNKDLCKVFKKTSSKDGFLEVLDIYMDILTKNNSNIKLFKEAKIENKRTKLKLNEIIAIYEKYRENINDKYIDKIGELDIFLNNILPKLDYTKTHIYFDAYNNFNELELKLVSGLLEKRNDITISLCTDICSKEDIENNVSESIFEVSNKTYLKLQNICDNLNIRINNILFKEEFSKQNENIKYLADNLLADDVVKIKCDKDNVFLKAFSNLQEEINFVAKKIKEEIKIGKRYNDFLIYTTNIDKYKNIVSSIFYEYDIPFYTDSKEKLQNSNLVKYIVNILNIWAYSLNEELLFDILKLGFNEIEDSDIYIFENYVKEFNINISYMLNKEFILNNKNTKAYIYNLDKLNEIRIKILNIFSYDLEKEVFVKDIVEKLYTHLIENNILEKYKKEIENSVSNKNIYNINSYKLEIQVWNKIVDVLNSICKIQDKKISVKDFCYIFKLAIKDISIKNIPPTLDQVILADINVSKIKNKSVVFFVGVIENEFPKKEEQDIFFTDHELENMKSLQLTLKETTISKYNMSMYDIYEALKNCMQELYITVPISNFSGDTKKPSSLFDMIKKIIDVKVEVIKSINDTDNMYNFSNFSKEEAFEKLNALLKEENKEENTRQQIFALYEYFKTDESYNKVINYVKDDDNLKKEVIDKIYDNNLVTSVSKLELFKKCPFSYFVKYVLEIEKRKEYDITSMDIGSFLHSVIERFSKFLFENNIGYQEILDVEQKLEIRYKEKINEIIEEELDRGLKKHKESIKYAILKQKLVNTINKVIFVIARGFNQSEFKPYGYEIEFNDKKEFTPICIKLNDNKEMKIIGKIDRIDTLKVENKIYARIIDYKSSSKTLDLDKIKEGISLQLVTYLQSFIENKEKNIKEEIIPSGMLYFNLSDKLLNLTDYTNDEKKIEIEVVKKLRMQGIFLKDIKILEKMDKKINDSKERLIDISPKTLDKPSKKALDETEFKKLCKEAKTTLKSIGNEILNGVVKISPNKKEDYCKYCDYSSICRKDCKL